MLMANINLVIVWCISTLMINHWAIIVLFNYVQNYYEWDKFDIEYSVLIHVFRCCSKAVSLNNLFRYVCFLCKGKWVSALTRSAKLIALEHVCCLHPQTGYDGKYVWSMPHDLQISHHLTTKVGSYGSYVQGLVEFFLNFNRTSLRKDKCRCFEKI